MKKILCAMLILSLVLMTGCGQQKSATDANQIPQEVSDGKTADGSKTDEQKPAEESPKNYLLAADDLSNLQLDDPTTPVYDKYNIWERQEKNLPVALPNLTPYENESVVYLTFDDGPDDVVTPQILDTLKAEGVKATFYVCGNMVDTYPNVLKRIFDEGHAVGNHSYNHNYDDLYSSPWNFMEQILKAEDSIRNVIGVRPMIIRAPGGANGMFTNDNFFTMVADCGYVEHDWNALTADATPERPNASTQINNVLQNLGDTPPKTVIVLMHCNSDKTETAKALPELIHLFRDWGYKFGVVTPMTPQPW